MNYNYIVENILHSINFSAVAKATFPLPEIAHLAPAKLRPFFLIISLAKKTSPNPTALSVKDIPPNA